MRFIKHASTDLERLLVCVAGRLLCKGGQEAGRVGEVNSRLLSQEPHELA